MLNIHPMVQSRSRNDLAGIDPIPQSQLKEEQLQLVFGSARRGRRSWCIDWRFGSEPAQAVR